MVGTPHTDNYTLGRGELSYAAFDNTLSQKALGFRYLGNTPDFSLNVATTSLDHFDSDHGLKTKDQQVTLEVNRTGSFATDDVSLANLALFFSGTKSTKTTSVATVTAEAHNAVAPDQTIVLGISNSNPTGQRNLTAVTSVTNDAGSPVTYVAGTDYTVNLATGDIYIVPGGAITAGTNLKVSYSTGALSNDVVISGNTPIEGALRFISYAPVGASIDYFIPWVKITPDGDYALKGDAWQTIKFKVEILNPNDGRAAIYAQGRPYTPGP